jgi:hypothetical protein
MGSARNGESERAKAVKPALRGLTRESSSELEDERDWTKEPLVSGQQLTAFEDVDS